jgi:hypothetical protein
MADEAHILQLMQRYSIMQFDYSEGNSQMSLRLPQQRDTITAPCAGIFLDAHPATGKCAQGPFKAGDILGFLQTGAMLRPITAPRDGHFVRPLACPGRITGYGTPLFDFY